MCRTTRIAALAMLSLTAALACVSSPVIAPLNSEIFLSANPNTIVLDEFANPAVTSGSTAITAQVLSMEGVPQSGVTVVFTANGGALASSPPGQPPASLKTDDNGFVTDTLTLQLGDPASTTVTVRSGSLTNTIAIDKTEIAPNQPPLAVAEIRPTTVVVGDTVIYDGSGSIDPDGDTITCFQWMIETRENIPPAGGNNPGPDLACLPPDNNARCEVTQGSRGEASIIDRFYIEEQSSISVTLRVTDDPSVICDPNGPAEPRSAFGGLDVASHDVVCDRFMPSARGTASHGIQGTPPFDLSDAGGSISVILSGSTSNGGDSGITDYQWSCPGSNTPNPVAGEFSSCDYSTTGTFVVTLTVTNGCFDTDTSNLSFTINP